MSSTLPSPNKEWARRCVKLCKELNVSPRDMLRDPIPSEPRILHGARVGEIAEDTADSSTTTTGNPRVKTALHLNSRSLALTGGAFFVTRKSLPAVPCKKEIHGAQGGTG